MKILILLLLSLKIFAYTELGDYTGSLISKATQDQINDLTNRIPGLIVFNEEISKYQMWNGFSWEILGTGGGSGNSQEYSAQYLGGSASGNLSSFYFNNITHETGLGCFTVTNNAVEGFYITMTGNCIISANFSAGPSNSSYSIGFTLNPTATILDQNFASIPPTYWLCNSHITSVSANVDGCPFFRLTTVGDKIYLQGRAGGIYSNPEKFMVNIVGFSPGGGGGGGGGIAGPATTTVDDLVFWADTTGSTVKGAGININDIAIFSPPATVTENTLILGSDADTKLKSSKWALMSRNIYAEPGGALIFGYNPLFGPNGDTGEIEFYNPSNKFIRFGVQENLTWENTGFYLPIKRGTKIGDFLRVEGLYNGNQDMQTEWSTYAFPANICAIGEVLQTDGTDFTCTNQMFSSGEIRTPKIFLEGIQSSVNLYPSSNPGPGYDFIFPSDPPSTSTNQFLVSEAIQGEMKWQDIIIYGNVFADTPTFIGEVPYFDDDNAHLSNSGILFHQILTNPNPFTEPNRILISRGNDHTITETSIKFPTTLPLIGQILKATATDALDWADDTGGGSYIANDQDVGGGTVTLENIGFQSIVMSAGASLPLTLNPFLKPNGLPDRARITLWGDPNGAVITVQHSDTAGGAILFGLASLSKYNSITLEYNETYDRYIEIGRNF